MTDSRDVARSPDDAGRPSETPQPLHAAASDSSELRLLVSELRAVIADLRAENRRLREEHGERPAEVTDIATRRGR